MSDEILSARQVGKTLQSMIKAIKKITPIDNYILYIRQELFDEYIDVLNKYIPLNVEVEATDYLPKYVNAVYMKTVNSDDIFWKGYNKL